jgi:ribosomal protein S18 acetylase RimI-like enzyme
MAELRRATQADGPALRALDVASDNGWAGPGPQTPADRPFFRDGEDPADVLVAEIDGVIAGYVHVVPTLRFASNAHVRSIIGLAVDPARQRSGLGRLLLEEVIAEARAHGIRRLRLRVLEPNTAARALYERCGFEVEGILREEFFLDGRYVDDLLLALVLG